MEEKREPRPAEFPNEKRDFDADAEEQLRTALRFGDEVRFRDGT